MLQVRLKDPGLGAPRPNAQHLPAPPSPAPQFWNPHPTALTHPEVVEALGHAEMLRRDVGLEVLVETWLKRDEFGQWWEVVHLLCRRGTLHSFTLNTPP